MKRISSLTLLALLSFGHSQQAMAQETPMNSASGCAFRCLQEKWPDIQSSGGGRHVFVPETGQNLAWDKDKQAWIDVKTLQPVRGPCTLPGALFKYCLQKKWPDIQSSGGGRHVFVPETGQNLAWDRDKQAWIDVKTGKCICPECPGQTTENVLKTIGSSIHLQIGGGGTFGHDEHHHERHGSATHRTETHKTSTTHKTVTAGCKCHPCTCSPCTCH